MYTRGFIRAWTQVQLAFCGGGVYDIEHSLELHLSQAKTTQAEVH